MSFLITGVLCLCAGCAQKDSELVVGAASSLTNVMEEVATEFEAETGIRIKMSYASSGTLRKQIEDGAPIDVFISASEHQMDELVKEKLITNKTIFLKNRLILAYNKNDHDINQLEDILKFEDKISLGEPTTVPAGKYAKETLVSLGIYKQLNERLVLGKNVRQVADYLNQGAIGFGFTYKTDLEILDDQLAYLLIAENTHTPINYPYGLVTDTDNNEDAQLFITFLENQNTQNKFKERGFEIIEK